MITYAICNPDGSIISVCRCDELPDEYSQKKNIPEGGFLIDLSGQEPFDTQDILEIHNGYQADAKKKKLIKRKKTVEE
jgi:hypothetical protein